MNSTPYDWEAIRAGYESGATMGELSRKHGVSKPAISKRAQKEGWVQDAGERIRRLAQAKVNGLVNTVNPEKKRAAIEAAADARADVITRHQSEWSEHMDLIRSAIAQRDLDAAKLAKITAETLRIRQEGERKAWGLEAQAQPTSGLTKEQIDAINSAAAADA